MTNERETSDPSRDASLPVGHFEGVAEGFAVGWAQGDGSSKDLCVEIWENDNELASGEAEATETHDGSAGKGQHRFRIPLPSILSDGKKHVLRAKTRSSSAFLDGIITVGTIDNTEEFKGLQVDDKVDRPTPQDKSSSIEGYFDGIVDGRASGWAYDKNEPTRRLQVEIWEGNIPLATGLADRLRGDLRDLKVGDGRCSFEIDLPPRLYDGKKHALKAKIAENGGALQGVVRFSAPPTRGRIDDVEGLSVRGWIVASSPDPMTVDLICDGEVEATVELPEPIVGEQTPIQIYLAPRLADGNIHSFRFRIRQTGTVVAEAAGITPLFSTPETALQAFAREYPAFLSANAGARYESLQRHLSEAARSESKADENPRRLKQLSLAHAQLKLGIKEQNRIPETFYFPQREKPDVSIVIPVHNKFWVTYNCLAALLFAYNKASFEVIVVDDGSTDMTVDLERYASGITVLRNESSQGFVKSSNLGATSARGEFVVMLNNDTEACAGWIDELLYVFRNFRDVGLAGSKFIYPNGRLQEAGGIVFPNFAVWNYGRNGNPFEPRFNYTRQVDYVSGACIMLRKEVWDELGGFDEFFAPAYYEDNDLAFRVRAKGLRTYYTPFSQIVHFEGISSGTSVTSGVKRFQAVNEPKFRSRWAAAVRNYPPSLDGDIAKDRGVSLRALLIDVQIPQPDRDAGSYAAVQEMRLLQALGFKLTFIPTNLAYLGNYTEAAQRNGIECLYAPFQQSIEKVIQERGPEFDIIYITRYAVAEKYIDLIRQFAPNAKIVFNNADLHFLREIRAAITLNSSEYLSKAIAVRDTELAVMRGADVTLSYTETEAAVILSHNLNSTKVARCPWVIEVDDKAPPFEPRKGLAFLGNYQHPPNEEAMRYFVSEIMPPLRQEVPGLVLRIFGSNMTTSIRDLEDDDVIIEGFVDDVAEVYHNCRIFIAPLRYGAGIKGKVIGALASGTPTIMTTLAAEGIGISRGIEAITADNVSEWVSAISTLYADEKRWNEMSERALAFTRMNFSFENGLAKMRAALAMAGVYTG